MNFTFFQEIIAVGVFTLLGVSFILLSSTSTSEACTRVVYHGTDNMVISGRGMDWVDDMHSNLWLFPKGIKRDGEAGEKSIQWTSKYGSLIVSGYDVGTADGVNEAGLSGSLLYLTESDYGDPSKSPEKSRMSISLWLQYVLDNHSTVEAAVADLRQESFTVIAPILPNGRPAQLHLAITDPSGDIAVFEYVEGKLVIHHGKEYQVMTNSPTYDKQIALNEYWESVGGLVFLPGTNRAADRYARAAFLVNAIPKTAMKDYISAVPGKSYENQAIASVTSVMRSVGVPLGITTPDQPNISSTIWRTIVDHKNKVFYFDSATSPNTFWVTLSKLDFAESAPVQKIKLSDGAIFAGDISDQFIPTKSFEFLPAK